MKPPKPNPRVCRFCRHYDLASVQDRAGRVRRDNAARCNFDTAEIIAQLPVSVPLREQGRIRPNFMEPYEGEGCPQFAEREEV